MKTVAVARFLHEGNSFSPLSTTLAEFRDAEWTEGDAVPVRYRGTATELGGAVAFFERRLDCSPVWLRAAAAESNGPLTRDTFDAILGEIVAGLGSRPWDAVYLSLHGSLNVHGMPHADLEVLRAVRATIGKTPLGATFDLHANMSQPELDLLDIAVGYKCHPHVDMAEVAEKCLDLLLRRTAGEISPVGVLVRLNAMLPSIVGRTTDGPMAEVKAIAAAIERDEGLLDLTPFHGYTYGDSPAAGASAMAWADGDRAKAERAAGRLAAEMTARRDRLFVAMPGPEEAVARALDLARRGEGPVALIDAADHPGAGATADTPGLFRALMAARRDVPCACAFFFDPEAVARAARAGIGGTVDGVAGGRLCDRFGPGLPYRGKVLRLTPGRIVHVGPVMHGAAFDYGPTAVVDIEGVPTMFVSKLLSVHDPAFFALHGIDLAKLGVLAVKAKNQFRAAFRDVFKTMIDVDAPGPAAYDFAKLPWKVAPRTIWPLSGRG